MFNFFHNVAAKLAGVIGGFFISIGGSIAPALAPAPVTTVISTSTAEITTGTSQVILQKPDVINQNSTKKSVQTITNSVVPITPVQTSQQTSDDQKVNDLKAAQAAADEKNAAEAARNNARASADIIQSNLEQLRAVNQEVVTLNNKYLSDIATISKNTQGMYGTGLEQTINSRKDKYNSDYQNLIIKYQQIVVDSNNCGSYCPQILPQVN